MKSYILFQLERINCFPNVYYNKTVFRNEGFFLSMPANIWLKKNIQDTQ